MPNYQEVFPIGRALHVGRIVTANAGYDGSGTVQPLLHCVPPSIAAWSHCEATMISVGFESDTTEIINIFADCGFGYRLFYSLSISTTRYTEDTLTDLVIPAGVRLYASCVAGDDGMIYIHEDVYA